MSITVRKPSDEEIAKMKAQPTWGCDISTFKWTYACEETAFIIEGEVTVSYDGGEEFIQAGDYVVFPAGLNTIWDVTKPIKKHYLFEE